MKKVYLAFVGLLMILTGCSTTETIEADSLDIYFVRHGTTWFNTTEQVQGFADSPLTDEGKDGAIKAGKGLADVDFTAAYSSDLGRQRDTLQLILDENNHEIPEMQEHDGFKEWNYGGFEGKTNAEMWDKVMEPHGLKFDNEWSEYPELVEILGDDGIADAIHEADPLKAAETYDQINLRGKEAMEQVISDNKDQSGNILIVSSGSMIPSILEIITPGQYEGDDIANSSLTLVKYEDGEYILEFIGDTSYME